MAVVSFEDDDFSQLVVSEKIAVSRCCCAIRISSLLTMYVKWPGYSAAAPFHAAHFAKIEFGNRWGIGPSPNRRASLVERFREFLTVQIASTQFDHLSGRSSLLKSRFAYYISPTPSQSRNSLFRTLEPP